MLKLMYPFIAVLVLIVLPLALIYRRAKHGKSVKNPLYANPVSYTHLDVYKRQGYGGGAVGAVFHECAVVGEDEQPVILPARCQRGAERARHALGEALDGVNLVLQVVVVRGLVRALQVYRGEVVPLQAVQRGGRLGLVVDVYKRQTMMTV